MYVTVSDYLLISVDMLFLILRYHCLFSVFDTIHQQYADHEKKYIFILDHKFPIPPLVSIA